MDKISISKSCFVAMLAHAGVAFECTERTVRIVSSSGSHNEGTDGLYTLFCFNKQGELVSVGTWGAAKEELKAVA